MPTVCCPRRCRHRCESSLVRTTITCSHPLAATLHLPLTPSLHLTLTPTLHLTLTPSLHLTLTPTLHLSRCSCQSASTAQASTNGSWHGCAPSRPARVATWPCTSAATTRRRRPTTSASLQRPPSAPGASATASRAYRSTTRYPRARSARRTCLTARPSCACATPTSGVTSCTRTSHSRRASTRTMPRWPSSTRSRAWAADSLRSTDTAPSTRRPRRRVTAGRRWTRSTCSTRASVDCR
mmetsp:Transcript_28622/g.67529  ORF Transcript_28622/g.67529 Transcript_28622/m.67529 type:complete len:239 (-) Transcript_28622:83-799(-)